MGLRSEDPPKTFSFNSPRNSSNMFQQKFFSDIHLQLYGGILQVAVHLHIDIILVYISDATRY